ncbi:unnamed protein product [marine sediment metagenome]|uniref:Leucine-rich repeat domain-containing protein n=1 Tax=marine sediment metagenome TaxID=412755 RepID=X0YZX7_9ZZZZ
MAIDNPTIKCGDDTVDLEVHFIDICNVNLYDYLEDNKKLTRDKFQKHFVEILDLVESWAPDFPEYNNVAYQLLGLFVLKLGAKLPDDVRERIIEATDWRIDKKIRWSPYWIRQRQFYLYDLREKIKNHMYGKISHLVELDITDDRELKDLSIGLEQFHSFIKNGHIKSINHINLDSCGLKKIPDSIFELKHLEVLSLIGNELSHIPDEMRNLLSLERLYLKYNYIKELPDSMRNLKNLRFLIMSNNQLRSVPKFILDFGVKHFAGLALYHNPIGDIPLEFKDDIVRDYSYEREQEKEEEEKQKFNIKWYI